MKEFDLEALEGFDGKEGRPAYVAHGGKVYDVSESKLWKGGSHMRRHQAGRDLATDIQAAPHGAEMLDRYPQVGVLKTPAGAEPEVPELLERLFKLAPMLRRHPHPMTVHFPIVCMLFAPLFTVLYLLTGHRPFETTALHCLGAGLLFLPVVILTGLLTWWVNYGAKPMMSITIKLSVSLVLFVTSVIGLTWRVARPEVLESLAGPGLAYLLLVLSVAPMVVVVGWFGAQLTFPFEKE
ncbi:MAG: cytochrome b5 [Syntrophobacteraceae bacterium]|nr:cytochrome b5 [Syntrophobacteraceae bacterium]MCU0588897.1 cytochrome b5 [Syntrophobacteraceae bacterium]